MLIYPRKYKAFTIEGQNVFPLYGMSGNLCASYAAILWKDSPWVLNGGDFGTDYGNIRSDEGGAWIVVKIPYGATESDVAHEVRLAEEKLDGWKP